MGGLNKGIAICLYCVLALLVGTFPSENIRQTPEEQGIGGVWDSAAGFLEVGDDRLLGLVSDLILLFGDRCRGKGVAGNRRKERFFPSFSRFGILGFLPF